MAKDGGLARGGAGGPGGGTAGGEPIRINSGISGKAGASVQSDYKPTGSAATDNPVAGRMPTPAGGSRYVSSGVTVRARATGNTGGSEQVRAENARPVVKDAKALKAANAPTNRTGSAADKASRASWNEPKNKPNQARAMKYVQDSAKKPGGWSDRNTKRGK